MPNRAVCLFIVVFWLVATTWFVRREIAPRFYSEAPPPFVIDFSDEAVRSPLPVRWSLTRNGQRLSPAQTVVQYRPEDDTFTLTSIIWKFELLKIRDTSITVEPFKSHYHVTRSGELLGIENDVQIGVGTDKVHIVIAADVQDGWATPRCKVESPWGNFEPKLDPMPIASGGMLNSMHPIHRINGLRVGQHWRIPQIDPLADVQRAAIEAIARSYLGNSMPKLPTWDRKMLTAEVTGPQLLEWTGREHACYVVEYRGDGLIGRTWVRVSDGLVLRQEAFGGGDELIMQRE